MSRFQISFLLALLLWAGPSSSAPAPGLREAVNAQVAAARKVSRELGVDVVDLETGASVYSFEAETSRIVASNMKLVTTAAGLEYLGPGYFFETSVLVAGDARDGALVGQLAVVGGGDPNLSGRRYDGDSYGAFREWAAALRGLGISRIEGDAILVDGLFEGRTVHPDWPKDQLTAWYEAPVAALSFNDNCVLVKVRAGAKPGAAAVVEIVPPLDLFTIENRAKTSTKSRARAVRIGRRAGASNVLTISGSIGRSAGSAEEWVAVADPLEYFGAALRAAFAEEGVTIAGRVRPAEQLPPAGWRQLYVHRSDLLGTLEVINKRSQNFFAESLLKVLAARLCASGSWEAGTRLLGEYLESIGLERGSFQLADGSGLSRGNRLSPRQLTHLLEHMFRHRWGTEFLRTLAFSGEADLRWEKRLAEPPYRGNVLAKTGTLNGVSSLSGYAKARSGKLYAFSILCNRTAGSWQAKKAQDRIVQAIIDRG